MHCAIFVITVFICTCLFSVFLNWYSSIRLSSRKCEIKLSSVKFRLYRTVSERPVTDKEQDKARICEERDHETTFFWSQGQSQDRGFETTLAYSTQLAT